MLHDQREKTGELQKCIDRLTEITLQLSNRLKDLEERVEFAPIEGNSLYARSKT